MMKKMLSLLLCAALACAAVSAALADDADLREAIATGRTLMLTKAEIQAPGEDFDGMPVGISPDGQTVIWRTSDSACLTRNGQVIPIRPAPERGAGDPYGKLEWEWSDLLWTFPADEGLPWSPDGRYVLLCSKRMATQLVVAQDLVMLDTETGEVFLAQSYEGGSKERGDFVSAMNSEHFGVVAEARFDLTGEYVYFIGRINAFSDTFSLFRFGMSTGETELMLEDIGVAGVARSLYPDRDGSWLLMVSSDNGSSKDTHDVWIRFDPEQASSWLSSFFGGGGAAKGSVWKYERGFQHGRMRGLQACYSAETGVGLVLVSSSTVGSMANMAQTSTAAAADLAKVSITPAGLYMSRLNRITPESTDPNAYWELRRDQEDPDALCIRRSDEAVMDIIMRFSADPDLPDEEMAVLRAFCQTITEENPPRITCVCQSPGGSYALICTDDSKSGAGRYWLLDLDTMAMVPVETPEGLGPVLFGTSLTGNFRPGMVWNEDGTLLILNGGTVEAYRLEAK